MARRGAIEIVRDGLPAVSVPVADVAVVLVGVKVTFSAAVIHRLLSNDIAVLICDWKGVPEGGAFPWSTHGRVAARHRSQAYLSVPRQKNAWGRIVKSKVLGQAKVLEDHGRIENRELYSLARDVKSGDPNNIEGRAARIYWQALWRDEGFVRHASTGSSWRNACLDYAYTVLRGYGIRAVLGAGLYHLLSVFSIVVGAIILLLSMT